MNETEHIACQQKKDEELLKFLVLFLDKNCFCVYKSDFILSICRFHRLDIFAMRQIRYVFTSLKLDMI